MDPEWSGGHAAGPRRIWQASAAYTGHPHGVEIDPEGDICLRERQAEGYRCNGGPCGAWSRPNEYPRSPLQAGKMLIFFSAKVACMFCLEVERSQSELL